MRPIPGRRKPVVSRRGAWNGFVIVAGIVLGWALGALAILLLMEVLG